MCVGCADNIDEKSFVADWAVVLQRTSSYNKSNEIRSDYIMISALEVSEPTMLMDQTIVHREVPLQKLRNKRRYCMRCTSSDSLFGIHFSAVRYS